MKNLEELFEGACSTVRFTDFRDFFGDKMFVGYRVETSQCCGDAGSFDVTVGLDVEEIEYLFVFHDVFLTESFVVFHIFFDIIWKCVEAEWKY